MTAQHHRAWLQRVCPASKVRPWCGAAEFCTTVTLAHRGDRFDRAKPRNRDKLQAAVAGHRLRLLLETHVAAICDGEVALRQGDRLIRMAADYVMIRIGGEAPSAFLERIGIRMVVKELPIAEPVTRHGEADAA